jgi:carbamoyltransferase
MNVLGINANFFSSLPINESSVSLVQDGKLVACIAEERLSRKKMDGSFPNAAIKEVLKISKLDIKDIHHVAVTSLAPADTNKNYLMSAISTYVDTGVFLGEKIKNFGWYYLYNVIKGSRKKTVSILGKDFKLHFNDHHLCHASGAFYCSPFNEALVVTLDGGGDGLDGGIYAGRDKKLQRLGKIPHFQSPGTMYSAITHDLGFKRHRHEGKITGLAAYGNSDLNRLGLEELLRYDVRKHRFISKGIAEHHKKLLERSKYFYPLLSKFPKEDLAAATQKIFEDEVIHYIRDAHNIAKKKGFNFTKICLAGGCFANVKLNQRIMETGLFDDIFVFPAMGDDGLSAGAALLTYYDVEPNATREASKINDTYLGGDFTEPEIENALVEYKLKYSRIDEVEKYIAKLLSQGKVVARFNGRMEYGPRALGNRSVIAAPFDKSINDWLNKKFNRTEFMPFAPSMNEENACDYLENYKGQAAADYMTITYDIKKGVSEKIPAVVHVDNTARPQIVKSTTNKSYHSIIREFHHLTGIAVVLNTSFNMHEEPIVYTPSDAIRGFLDAKLDYLAIGNFIVSGEDLYN